MSTRSLACVMEIGFTQVAGGPDVAFTKGIWLWELETTRGIGNGRDKSENDT